MSSGSTPSFNDSPGIHCRHTTYMDILMFLALVPVLHAFTAPPSPGSGAASTTTSFLISLFSPYIASANAIHIIGQRFRSCRTSLQRALRARALCMLVPREWGAGELVDPEVTRVHGQLPSSKDGKYDLVLVPDWYHVEPQLQTVGTGEMKLACSSNLLRVLAAIVQILYGSYLICKARNPPLGLSGYPYESYAVVAVPYVLMSFLNLIALLCRPHYAGLYVVGFRGKKSYPGQANAAPDAEKAKEVPVAAPPSTWTLDAESKSAGTVGYTYSLTEDSYAAYDREHRRRELCAIVFQYIILALFFAAPYPIIHALPAFHYNPSTLATAIALATGQIICICMALVEGCMLKRYRLGRPPVFFPFTDWRNLKWTRPAEVRAWWDKLLTGWAMVGLLGRAVAMTGVVIVASVAVVGWRVVAREMWEGQVCIRV